MWLGILAIAQQAVTQNLSRPPQWHIKQGRLACEGALLNGGVGGFLSEHFIYDHLLVTGIECSLQSLPLKHVGNLTIVGDFTHDLAFPFLKKIANLELGALDGKSFYFPVVKLLGDVTLTKVTANTVLINARSLGHVIIDECHISSLDFGQLQTAHNVKLQRSTFERFQMHMLESVSGDLIIVMNQLSVAKALPMLRIVKGSVFLHIIEARAINSGVEFVGGELLIAALKAKVIKFDKLVYLKKKITLIRAEELLLFSLSKLNQVNEIHMQANTKMLRLNPRVRWAKRSLFNADNFCEMYSDLFLEKDLDVAGGCQNPICHSSLALSNKDLPEFNTCTTFYGNLIIDRRVTGNLTRSLLTSIKGSLILRNQERFPFSHLSEISETLLITGQSKHEIWDLSQITKVKTISIKDVYGITKVMTHSSLVSTNVFLENTSLKEASFSQQELEILFVSNNPTLSTFKMPKLYQTPCLTLGNNPTLNHFSDVFPKLDHVISGVSLLTSDARQKEQIFVPPKSLYVGGRMALWGFKRNTETLFGFVSPEFFTTQVMKEYPRERKARSYPKIGSQETGSCKNFLVNQSHVENNPCQIIQGDLVIDAADHPATIFFPTVVYGNFVVKNLDAEVTFPRLRTVHGKFICHSEKLYLVNIPFLNSVGGLDLSHLDFLPTIFSNIIISREFSLKNSGLPSLPRLNLHRCSKLVLENNKYLKKITINFGSGMAERIVVTNNPHLDTLQLDSLTFVSHKIIVTDSALRTLEASISHVGGSIVIERNAQLTRVSFPALVSLDGPLRVAYNPHLAAVSFPRLQSLRYLATFCNNSALMQSAFNHKTDGWHGD